MDLASGSTHDRAPSPRLPLELLLLICDQQLPLGTLAVLCRTWRAFQATVEQRLYRKVHLVGVRLRVILAWCSALRRRAHLPKLIHTIHIQLPHPDWLSQSDMDKIAEALVACVNLKVLHLLRTSPATGECGYDWVLHSCPFRLHEFACSYFDEPRVKTFLATQSDLRLLRVFPGSEMSLDTPPCPELPNLVGLQAPLYVFDGLRLDRKLQRLELVASRYREVPNLAPYSETLTTLNVLLRRSANRLFGGTLDDISRSVPALVHLAIVGVRDGFGLLKIHENTRERLPRLAPFARLETFTVLYRDEPTFDPDVSIGFAGGSAEDEDLVRGVVERCFQDCSSLRRVVVGTVARVSQFYEVPPERMYINTKDSSGEIDAVVQNRIDFEAISMFSV